MINRLMKGFYFFLMGMSCMQAAFARNQVDFVFHHLPDIGVKPSKNIYLFVNAWRLDGEHSAGTRKDGLPVGERSVDNVRGTFLAPNPSGFYMIEINCSLTHSDEDSQTGLSVEKWIPRNGTVFIDGKCPFDKDGQPLVPSYHIDVESK